MRGAAAATIAGHGRCYRRCHRYFFAQSQLLPSPLPFHMPHIIIEHTPFPDAALPARIYGLPPRHYLVRAGVSRYMHCFCLLADAMHCHIAAGLYEQLIQRAHLKQMKPDLLLPPRQSTQLHLHFSIWPRHSDGDA